MSTTPATDSPVSLEDRYRLEAGRVLLTGVQAAARIPFEQMRADRAASVRGAAFVSGYQGSPLGTLDSELRPEAPLF